ncbi:MAG: hypothetical protein ABJB05_07540 [Parafilimonas sp.]
MDKIIKERLSVIVSFVVGGTAGFSLSSFIQAQEIKQWLTGIAIAFSLIVSLIISAWYKSISGNKKKFVRYAVICAVIFVVMMPAFFVLYNMFETRLPVTVQSRGRNYITTDSVFIRGLYFSGEAKSEIDALKKSNPVAGFQLADLFKDSNYDIDMVWTNTSRILAKLLIIFSYMFFIASLIACITFTTELIQDTSNPVLEQKK